MNDSPKKKVPCDACNGTGVVANATEEVTCSACDGTGKVDG